MRNFTLIALSLLALGAKADWNTNPDGVTLWPNEISYPDFALGVSAEGTTWTMINLIGTANDGEGSELYYCQALDKDGNALLGDTPMLLSDEYYQTYTLIEDNLLVDADGNALIGVIDKRTGYNNSITIYKLSPEGKQLWGEKGICIDGGLTSDFIASLGGIQLSDGSYVFAWMSANERNANLEIVLQRVLADGTLAWDAQSVKLSSKTADFVYPHLQDAGNNQFLLSYATGSSQALVVMKYDFDGTPVWSEPTEVYNGGWGSTPMWIKVNYAPSGDGGMLIVWYADPDMDNLENAFMQYVKPNGQLGFNERNGLRIDYTEYVRILGLSTVYDASTDSFVCAFMGCDGNQVQYLLKLQRVSKKGELMWGEESWDIVELSDLIIGAPTVMAGNNGEVGLFYQEAFNVYGSDVTNHAVGIDVAKKSQLWHTTFGYEGSPKGGLMGANATKAGFWVAAWKGNDPGQDKYSSSMANIFLQRINYDGTIGNPAGINSVESDKANHFVINGNSVSFATRTQVYDLQGRLVSDGFNATLKTGVYLCRDAQDIVNKIFIP